jgi:hypothetical protein
MRQTALSSSLQALKNEIESNHKKEPFEKENRMRLLNTIFQGVFALALCSKRKTGQIAELLPAEPELDRRIDWFPTADGLRSEMWH